MKSTAKTTMGTDLSDKWEKINGCDRRTVVSPMNSIAAAGRPRGGRQSESATTLRAFRASSNSVALKTRFPHPQGPQGQVQWIRSSFAHQVAGGCTGRDRSPCQWQVPWYRYENLLRQAIQGGSGSVDRQCELKGMIKSLEIKLKGAEEPIWKSTSLKCSVREPFLRSNKDSFACFLPPSREFALVAQAKEENKLYELSVRASKINPQAKEHPKLNFTFAEVKGKNQDLQHAPSRHSYPVP